MRNYPQLIPVLFVNIYSYRDMQLPMKDGSEGGMFGWWRKDTKLLWHELGMYSAYFSLVGNQNQYNLREDCHICDEFKLYGDSGGFQNMSLGANLDPLEVLRWQELNCQVGMTFDYPLFEKSPAGQLIRVSSDRKVFKDKMRRSARNAWIASDKKENEKMKLYAAIHGYTPSELNEWVGLTNKEHDYDGYALGCDQTYMNIALAAAYAYEYLDKPMHLFRFGSAPLAAGIIWFFRDYPHKITFDASTYIGGSKYFDYGLPNGTKVNVSMRRSSDDFVKFREAMPCRCPICRDTKLFEMLYDQADAHTGTIGVMLSMHNIYNTTTILDSLNELAYNEKVFMNTMKRLVHHDRRMKDFYKAKKFFDLSMDVGLEKAWNKFNPQQKLTKFFDYNQGD